MRPHAQPSSARSVKVRELLPGQEHSVKLRCYIGTLAVHYGGEMVTVRFVTIFISISRWRFA
jgi:hypothetical protein